MANSEHLSVLREGVEAWNRWRESFVGLQPDLTNADLTDANLSEAILAGADLSGATLHRTNFSGANLARAVLKAANLSAARLFMANLDRAQLGGADLRRAYFIAPQVAGTNFQDALLGWTVFGECDLRLVQGLETVRHRGPSTIGIDTIYRSNGELPEQFLRGAGVPDSFVVYARSLASQPVSFYSCFISYSTKDQELAERLHADMQAKGVRCWFAPHDVRGGRKLYEQIDEAIRLYDRLLLILSEHSMNSEWVKTEIAHARQKELNEKRQVLFPIRLVPFEKLRDFKCFDADAGKDSAREIREYFIPDFSNWKDHDAYQQAFQRLVRDLKADPV